MQQQFSQFPSQEYAWNLADEILLGNMNVDTSSNNRWEIRNSVWSCVYLWRACVVGMYGWCEWMVCGG